MRPREHPFLIPSPTTARSQRPALPPVAPLGAGANSSTTVSGTGTGASVSLAVGGGTGANGAYSCASGTCNLAGATYNYTTFNISRRGDGECDGNDRFDHQSNGECNNSGDIELERGQWGRCLRLW